jgi:hypothetical protein
MGKFYFEGKACFNEKRINNPAPKLVAYRDYLAYKFNRQMALLMESKRPRKVYSPKGRLSTNRVYRYPFSDNIFQQNNSIPKTDTTFVMLIDGSGSMSSYCEEHEGERMNRLNVCSAICSAFAKSVQDVLKNELKFHVFLKSAPAVYNKDYGGQFTCLTRVLTNEGKANDFNKILSLDGSSPLYEVDSHGRLQKEGSYTAEYAVLPALMKWFTKNITTKNVVVINLTDGETYCRLGDDDANYQFGNDATRQLRIKYLRGIPNICMMIGREMKDKEFAEIYGQDSFVAKEGFENKLFSTLLKQLDSATQ